MPRFRVELPLTFTVEVDAKTAKGAVRVAQRWLDWVEPTHEQLWDFHTDHRSGVVNPGAFTSLEAGAEEVEDD